MHKGKLFIASLAALALPLAAAAQTRTRRTPAAKPSVRRAAPAAAKPPAGGVSLTAEDMSLLIEGLKFPPEVTAELAANAEERRSFARDIRRMLAAAAEARAAGFAERPEVKLQLELGRALVIAQEYLKRRQEAGVKDPAQVVTDAEVEAFLKEPATAAQFEAFVADYFKNGPARGTTVTDAQRKELGHQYGRIMVAARKGVAAGLERDRMTQLMILRQQGRQLASAYVNDPARRFESSDAEVGAYIAKHPELDTKASRAKVEDILRRARAGEDFAKLADEFTDDPSGRGRGGDLGWFGRGMMVKPFEDAAFALKPGELSGVVESPFGFHVIKLEERRAGAGAGAVEEVRARHILIRYTDTPGDGSTPPMNPRDRARAAVEEEKRGRALDELAVRHRISVAEDYVVGVSGTAPGTPASRGKLPPVAKPPAQTRPASKPKPKTPARRGH
ncbi:MAG TPA: peptidylprolyl isomerase [Pyrinomonadaceae bacterium]|nr:peptidylprolyl isomerase [Pyrinomonadaceae bacterium]